MKRKHRKKQQDKGNTEWLNEKHIWRRRRKKDIYTPMLAHAETHYHGCCQHRCWAEGELSISARVCACRRLTVIWGLFSDDSCWHNAPFSLFIYTVQPISISSLFLIPPPSFSLNSSPPSSTLSPASWYFASHWIVMRRTPVVCVFAQQMNAALPSRNTPSSPAPHFFPRAIKRKAS